jgi:DNA-binding HxlR family transcriptional regulator
LDVLGDKWTLLVVRDLFRGCSKYADFLASPESIPTNLLADRLKKLEKEGLVLRRPYQDRPPRFSYALTGKGRDLWPVLEALGQWAHRHVPGTLAMPFRSKLEGN